MSMKPVSVSVQWARAAVVAAQHIPDPASPGEYDDAAAVLRGIGLIQLDPLTRVSTAQRLTCLTRLPRKYRAEDVDVALWPGDVPVSFESFTKVACIFPLQDWPLLQLRREKVRAKYGAELTEHMRQSIKEVVASQPRGVQIGTIEAALSSTRTTGWNWSKIKHAAELMIRTGELVITSRQGVVRLFDLPERALPPQLREAEHLPADELRAGLARRAAGTLAVMTAADFAHHYHLSRADAAQGIELAGLVPVSVDGWRDTAYCLPQLLDETYDGGFEVAGVGQPRQARLIGPFDPLLRDRGRARRIFDFDYTFEAYVPREKRLHGHYVMAVLSGSEMIGRTDLQRVGDVLQVNAVFPEPGRTRRSVAARAKAAAAILARQLGTSVQYPQ